MDLHYLPDEEERGLSKCGGSLPVIPG